MCNIREELQCVVLYKEAYIYIYKHDLKNLKCNNSISCNSNSQHLDIVIILVGIH